MKYTMKKKAKIQSNRVRNKQYHFDENQVQTSMVEEMIFNGILSKFPFTSLSRSAVKKIRNEKMKNENEKRKNEKVLEDLKQCETNVKYA